MYGQTGHHSTETGAKTEAVWHDIKAAVPGTAEHQLKEGAGAGFGGAGSPILHHAQNPVTGETHAHRSVAAASVDQGFQDLKVS